MAELSITVVPAKILADGSHKIRISVNHKNETRYIITRFKIDDLKQFKSGRVVGRTDANMINKKLVSLLNNYYDVLDSIDPDVFTCTQLKEYLETSGNLKNPVTSLSDRWQQHIDELLDNGKEGTAGLYQITKRFFEEKFGKMVILSSITANTVNTFEKALYKRGLCDTTVGMHMRNFKAIINSAVKMGLVEYKLHPFAFYTMPESHERELDITVEELQRIRDSKPTSRGKIIARDLFMLSYYLGGINLIDLLEVDFRGLDIITYVRTKTEHTKRGEKRVSLTIQPEAKEIIQRWAGPDGKLHFNYNFSYKNFRNYITHTLHDLAEDLGIKKRVVYYSARKSVVQHGFELGISLEIMEYTIGQSVKKNNRPIFNYVRFMRSFADEAMRKILDHIKEPVHKKVV